MTIKRLRVAIVCDYPEEGWPSMDVTAEMTLKHLSEGYSDKIEAVRVCAPYRHRCGRLSRLPAAELRRNIDRLLNRYLDYTGWLKQQARRNPFDLYHLVDHSYAQLVHALPQGRAVVTCHDLDTFRCLLRPDLEPRPAWFRSLTRKTLRGLQAAGSVVCVSEATRNAVLEHRLVPADRMRTIYPGTHPEFVAVEDPEADADIARLIGPIDPAGSLDLLHVGSNIPRKRIDVLLETFTAIRRLMPQARLIKVGSELTIAQSAMAQALGVESSIVRVPFLDDRRHLAALYRRVALVLQPSEAEGFGFPLVEAMSCGAPLLVSDLPVLREVAGDAALFAPVGDIPAWTEASLRSLNDSIHHTAAGNRRKVSGLARASQFRWEANAAGLVITYQELCS